MNLRDLEYLAAIAKHRNFHKAAQACFVSQPTLSAQLKKLEEYLGVVLVERNPGNILMTEVGALILERAQSIIQQSTDIKKIAKDYGSIYSSSMHLGLIPTVAPYLLPKISKVLRQTFPKLGIKLHELQTHQLLQALQQGDLDALVIALPVAQNLDGFTVIDLYTEKFYLAVNILHPLAKRKLLSIEDLRNINIVLLERGHCLREHVGDLCKSVDAHIDDFFSATSLETLRYMVAINEVATLMPELAIDKTKKADKNIAYIPFSGNVLSRKIVLAYRKNSYKEEVFSKLFHIYVRQYKYCWAQKHAQKDKIVVHRSELVEYCNGLLNVASFADYCPNGLQIEGKENIQSIVAGVTASEALIRRAIEVHADAVLVHHGYFWKNEPQMIVGMKKNRIALLLQHDINLIAYHLPLDAHPELGNNAQLAKVLHFDDVHTAQDLVFTADLQQTLTGAELAKRIAIQLQREALWVPGNQSILEGRVIKKVAWCTGAAQDFIQLAIAKGADAFISGEVSESTVHIAREQDIHFYAAGHHATERYGIKALAQHLAEVFNIQQAFIDIDNPV